MAMWNDIVEAANNRDPCDRCGGKGKVPLFSSVEDPCRKCDGFGSLSPSDGSDNGGEDDEGDDDGCGKTSGGGGSPGNQTNQNTIPSPLAAFLDHKAQALSQKSQFDRSQIDEVSLNHSDPPDQADLNSLVSRFRTNFCGHAKQNSKTASPFTCVSASKPHTFFRRSRNATASLNLVSHSSSFRVHTCWNQIPRTVPSVVPQNTLVVASFVPLQCAVYCQW